MNSSENAAAGRKEQEARPSAPKRISRWRLGLAFLAIAGTVGGLGCSTFTNRALLFPSRHLIETDAQRESFVGQGEEIAGLEIELFYKEYGEGEAEPDLYVLSLTGNAGRAETMLAWTQSLIASWMGRTGAPVRIGVLSLQYPGYGTRANRSASLASMAQATEEALVYLKERAHSRPIFIHALSMGTTAALASARSLGIEAVQGLIIEKPPNLAPLLLGEHGWWNAWLVAFPMALLLPDTALSDENAYAISHIPALFLIAEEDRVVPLKYAMQVFDAYGGPKRLLKLGGGHNRIVNALGTPTLDQELQSLWRTAQRSTPKAR